MIKSRKMNPPKTDKPKPVTKKPGQNREDMMMKKFYPPPKENKK